MAGLSRVLPAEGDLRNILDEFRLPVFQETNRPAGKFGPRANRQRPQKDNLARALRDIDKPARANQRISQLAHVDITFAVNLQEPQIGLVDSAALVEVEHVPGFDDRVGIVDRAEVESLGRNAAELAVLNRRDHGAG